MSTPLAGVIGLLAVALLAVHTSTEAAVVAAIVAVLLLAVYAKVRRGNFTHAMARVAGDEAGALSTEAAVLTGIGAVIALMVGAVIYSSVNNTACDIDTDFRAISGGVGNTGGGSSNSDEC